MFLGKTLKPDSHSPFVHPSVQMDTSNLNAGRNPLMA